MYQIYSYADNNSLTNCIILSRLFKTTWWDNSLQCVVPRRHEIKTEHEECTYLQTSDIRRILVGNKIVDHSDVVEAPPVGALQLHLHFRLTPGFNGMDRDNCKARREYLSVGIYLVCLILEAWWKLLGCNVLLCPRYSSPGCWWVEHSYQCYFE